jgi:hypothetical protein
MAEAATTRASRGAAVARAAAPRRRPAAAASGAPRRAGGARVPFPAVFRWARVLLLVAAGVVGLPLAHAVFGEVVALLGGAAVLGFLLGRWTAPNRGG